MALLARLLDGRESPGERCRALAAELLGERELHRLARASEAELASIDRVGARRAARLSAAFALGRAVERDRLGPRPTMRRTEQVALLLAPEVRGLSQETFHALLLDGKHRLRRRECISVGTLTSSLVHPREVFGPAVRHGAAALIVAHNHPSGDPEPSAEDIEVTRRLLEAGRLLGIPLLDHVVLGAGCHVSLRERMGFS